MKTIKLIEIEDFGKSRDLIKTMLETPQQQGLMLKDIRTRCSLIDKLEATSGDEWMLEDAEWDMLRGIVEAFRFAKADRQLLKILDLILHPQIPEGIKIKAAS